MSAHVRQPQRLGVADQLAEDAVAPWRLAELPASLLIDPDGQEALELAAPGIEHPERGVLGAGELARRVQHPLEDRLELRLGQHAAAEFDKRGERPVGHARQR